MEELSHHHCWKKNEEFFLMEMQYDGKISDMAQKMGAMEALLKSMYMQQNPHLSEEKLCTMIIFQHHAHRHQHMLLLIKRLETKMILKMNKMMIFNMIKMMMIFNMIKMMMIFNMIKMIMIFNMIIFKMMILMNLNTMNMIKTTIDLNIDDYVLFYGVT
ncbi:hypothetical protein KIW84_035192 [Lathyrus oleraceus]|uniref:Uncharacterized protein n=1 Tax=Pisum sativum TaxID=3888 RepID=A0A9D4Y1E6_PEA|nr:hypothetical protein KIW84_035192 [Pisum sativum]